VCTGDARFCNDVLARSVPAACQISSVDALYCASDTVKTRGSVDFTVIILRFDAQRAAVGLAEVALRKELDTKILLPAHAGSLSPRSSHMVFRGILTKNVKREGARYDSIFNLIKYKFYNNNTIHLCKL
jgi:hypothetical protein